MHASLKKFSTCCLLGSLSALPLVSGCEGLESDADQADRKAEAAVQTGLVRLQAGEAEEASSAVRAVTSEQALSAMGKARALSILAEAELAAGKKVLDELAANQVDAAATAWRMNQLISKLNGVTALGQSYANHDPSASRTEVQEAVKRAQGAPNAPVWFEDPEGDADLPSLSQINQTISQLEGQISDRRQKIAELTAQRDELNKQAEEVIAAAGQMKGQEAVDQFRRGTQLRQQAANIGSQIDQLNHQLLPLVGDLQVAQSHKQVIEQAIARYQEQIKSLDETWKTISAQMEEQGQLARQLLSGTGDELTSITGYADMLATLVEEGTQKRETANQHLRDAITYASQAVSAAESARTELGARAQTNANSKPAFETLRNTFNSSHFKLIQLNAQHTLATSLAEQAALVGMQVQAAARLDPLVKQGRMALPASLARTDLPAQWEAFKTQADEAFTTATELVEDIVQAPASKPEQRGTAQVYRALTEYAWAVAKRSAGDTEGAQQHIANARTAAQAAADLKAVLPPLPPEVQPAAAQPAGRRPANTGGGFSPPAAPAQGETEESEDADQE